MVIPIEFDNVNPISEGLAAVKKDDKYGFIDQTGRFLIQPVWSNAEKFSEGLAAVSLEDDSNGSPFVLILSSRTSYINRKGECVIPPKYYSGCSFSDGLASVSVPVSDDQLQAGFIDRTGEVVIQPGRWDEVINRLSEGVIAVVKDGKPLYIDQHGNVKIELPHDASMARFLDFSEGMARFSISTDGEYKYGFIDTSGSVVIPAHFDSTEDFDHGLARATVDDVEGLINKEGDFVWKTAPDWDDPLEVLDAVGAQFHLDPVTGEVARIGFDDATDDKLLRLSRVVTGLKGVTTMDLMGEVTGNGLALLEELQNLEELTLAATSVTDDGLKHLAGLKNLRILAFTETLTETPIDEGLQYLEGLESLEELDLSETIVTDESLKYLARLGRLRVLNLTFTDVTDAGLQHLNALDALEELDLMGTAVTGDTFKYLAKLKSLRSLRLAFTPVSDTGLKQLGGLQRLEYLDLMGTKVTDDGLEYLVGLGRLRFLRLVDTPITDAGLKHLMAMSDLRELEIQDTTVTEQGAAELQQALPKLKITLGDLSE